MDNFVNMTPHSINLVNSEHTALTTIEPSGQTLRVPRPKDVMVSELTVGTATVTVNRKVFAGLSAVVVDADGNETALSEPVEGTYYIVSRIACEAMPERSDLLMVDGTVRDENGRIIGCTGFAVL
jgi:hypothetical protein